MLIIVVGFFKYLIYKKGNHAAEPRGVERTAPIGVRIPRDQSALSRPRFLCAVDLAGRRL